MRESGERGMGEEAAGTAAKIHWVRILIGGFLAEALLILLVIPVAMKWGAASAAFSGAGRIAGVVFPVWVLGGAGREVAGCAARSAGWRGGDGDLSGADAAEARAVGVCRGTWSEAGRRSVWGMAGGAQSGMIGG